MPVLSLVDLGVVRDVAETGGSVVVTITPTYSGCPAMVTIRDDIVRHLREAGFTDIEVRTQLSPSWSSDWITTAGRRALAAAGYSVPHPARRSASGPMPLRLAPVRRRLACPRCGSAATDVISEFGGTPCKALYRCLDCAEPFEHVKEI